MIPRYSTPGSTALAGPLIGLAALIVLALLPLGAGATTSPLTATYLLSDDFAHDAQLNASLWGVNGPAATNFSSANCLGCANISLAPSFSSAGMEIAQINGSNQAGAIQSLGSFTPPFTVSTVVEAAVSHGRTFVFGITSLSANSGVQITGNLDPNDCSNETHCGNPATCGSPANASIQANQCFYGIYARVGTGGPTWPKTPELNLTPSIDVDYTLQISVDGSGLAQYNVSEGGQVVGQSSVQVGTGAFYIILGQSEGTPVPGPGPNQAYWTSVSVTPTAPPPPPSTSGAPPLDWTLILLAVFAVVVAALLVAYTRRRRLAVTVIDSATMSPVPGAGVWAEGPRNYSGNTGPDGRVGFGGVRSGDYSVRAAGSGYRPSVPARVPVSGSTNYTVRLDRMAPTVQPVGPAATVSEKVNSLSAPVLVGATPALTTADPVTPTVVAPPPVGAEESDDWGGGRIRQIVQTFRTRGALSPETALTADELGLSRIFVRAMKRRRGRTRVFVEVGGKYYLDEKALREMK